MAVFSGLVKSNLPEMMSAVGPEASGLKAMQQLLLVLLI